MKKITIQKGSILLLFIFAITQVQAHSKRKKADFSRSFKESYSINADATLSLDNDFTDVEIINWDKDEISIDVEINVNAKSEKEAEKWFNKILVEMTGNSHSVSLKTHLKKGNTSTSNNENWFVTATIHAPASINLDADMEFGNLTIDVITGVCTLDVEFGDVDADGFTNTNNDISIEYGDLEVATLACEEADVEFGEMKIGVLTSSCEISCDYSDVEIKMVSEGCTDLEIDVQFGKLDLTLASTSNFSLEASTSFGDIDLDSDFTIQEKDKGMFDLSYSATIGSGGGKIDIDSSYSDIKLRLK